MPLKKNKWGFEKKGRIVHRSSAISLHIARDFDQFLAKNGPLKFQPPPMKKNNQDGGGPEISPWIFEAAVLYTAHLKPFFPAWLKEVEHLFMSNPIMELKV